MSSVGSVYEVSLLLAYLIRHLDGQPSEQIIGQVQDYVSEHQLKDDIEACIVFADGDSKIQLVAISARGHDVLAEVVNSCEFIPCPSGACEYEGSICRWCGGFQN